MEDTYPNVRVGELIPNNTTALGATEQHFTGKERDTESGNDYFGARYYGSNVGRFVSPDDGSDQNASEPASWNLYSYGRNNPINSTDADGRTVTICSTDAYGNQHCRPISDEAYDAAQQAGNGGQLSSPALTSLENSASGAGTIKDSTTGAIVGTVQWTPENPGIQGPQAIAAFGQIGNQGMGAIKAFTVGSLVGGTLGGGPRSSKASELSSLNSDRFRLTAVNGIL